jgi:thiol-disulfide isomerase/thioredoxin
MRSIAYISLAAVALSFVLILSSCRDEPIDANPGTGELKVGAIMADFYLENEQSELVYLSDFRGKTVLVEFWASWCPYCIEEVPELHALYQEYRDEEFEIIGVSIDEKRSNWIAKLREINSPYTHLNDPRGFDSPLMEKYNIGSIPKLILIDGAGKVLAISTKTSEIRKALESYLN